MRSSTATLALLLGACLLASSTFNVADARPRSLSGWFDDFKDKIKDTFEGVKDAASDAGDQIRDSASDIGDSVKDAANNIGDASSDIRDKIKDAASDLRDKLKDAASDAGDNLKDNVGDAVDKAVDSSDYCPPPNFDTQANFDEFIRAPWYVQKQEPLIYQMEDSLFCVRSLYRPLKDNPKDGLRVFNYANKGKVNGPSTGAINFFGVEIPTGALPEHPGSTSPTTEQYRTVPGVEIPTVAIPEDPNSTSPTAASKLKVGPQFPGILGEIKAAYSSYWIAAAGVLESDEGYDWAIIVGGEPDYDANGLCSPNTHSRIFGKDLSRYSYSGVCGCSLGPLSTLLLLLP
eukprot:gene6694-3362_t